VTLRILPLLFVFAAAPAVPYSSADASGLSERETLHAGIRSHTTFRILRVKTRIDSLDVKDTRTQWLPQASASAGVSLYPYDTLGVSQSYAGYGKYTYREKTASAGTGETLSVAQHLPGGGSAGAALSIDHQRFIDGGDSILRTSSVGLTFTQPLLRDAWGNDPVPRSIRIARLDHERFTLEQKKAFLAELSDIRTRYWNCYEAQLMVSLGKADLAYDEQRMAMVRERFAIGLAAPLDTLTALLQLVNTTAQLHDAQSDELQAREELSLYTGIAADSLTVDSLQPVETLPLPSSEVFLKRVEQFDPQLRIFEVAAKRLDELERRSRNGLLPRLDFSAGWRRSDRENRSGGSSQVIGNSVIGLIASYSFPVRNLKNDLVRTGALQEQNTLERKLYRDQLMVKIGELTRSWERENRAIDIARTARAVAEQTFAASREGFAAGTVDRLSLEKAQNDYRSASVTLLKKQLLMKQLEIIFDEMTGETLARFGVELQ